MENQWWDPLQDGKEPETNKQALVCQIDEVIRICEKYDAEVESHEAK